MHFSLQDMVRQTVNEAERREKIAQAEGTESEESKKEKKAPPASQAQADNASTAPERNEESYEEKTASVFVEKLASAVEFVNSNFLKEAVGKPEPKPAHTPPQASKDIGAGKGNDAMPTNLESPTPGIQSEETGQATPKQQPPTNPGSDVSSPGQTNPGTALETDINSPPGGSEDWTKQDKLKQAHVLRIKTIMNKMAEDANNPAKVGAKTTNPHQSSPEGVSAAGEGKPAVPGEVSKQESMINSNESAINYTKQQAKAVPKARMGEVLDEPAQKKSTDPVLQNNLQAASSAGVKIASMQASAARALLVKLAEEGAKEDASPEDKERALKLQEALKAKEQEKSASAGLFASSGY